MSKPAGISAPAVALCYIPPMIKCSIVQLLPMLSLVIGWMVIPATAEEQPGNTDARPWIRWEWPQQGIENNEIKPTLKSFHEMGFGGVELSPEPYAQGESVPMIGAWPNLEWTEQAAKAAKICAELDLKVDIMAHPGPAPQVGLEEWSERKMTPFFASVRDGEIELELPEGEFDCLAAWSPHGTPVNLLGFIDEETSVLKWEAPLGKWNIIGTSHLPIGDLLNTNSPRVTGEWAREFANQFEDPSQLRAEVYERSIAPRGNWSPEFYLSFRQYRGYDLREHLPEMFGSGNPGTSERVVSDAYETISDLQLESMLEWHDEVVSSGLKSRSMIRGQAGHPIDLSMVADIPGVVFSGKKQNGLSMELIFASSAAHLSAKPIIQGRFDPGTEKALTPLILKEAVDMMWLGGINQITIDGQSSSQDESAAHLNPGNGLWKNIDALTGYIQRCQAALQKGAPDPDVLLYVPYHDFLIERNGIPNDPDEREKWLIPTSFYQTSEAFTEQGVVFDCVSDRALRSARVENGKIIMGELAYHAIVFPKVRRIPETTATVLLDLARAGGKIAMIGDWPEDVPGYPTPDIRRGTLISALQQIPANSLIESNDPATICEKIGIIAEPMAEEGLRFVRRKHESGYTYFVVNHSEHKFDKWISLAKNEGVIVISDPRIQGKSGVGKWDNIDGELKVRLVLEPGESRILTSVSELKDNKNLWVYSDCNSSIPISGNWNVQFPEDKANNPESFTTPILGSVKTFSPEASEFVGAIRYSIEFDFPAANDGATDTEWAIDLGEVAHSAVVKLNGDTIGKSIIPPHRLPVTSAIREGTNELVIEVNNLRTSDDEPRIPSGLLGPVRLIPGK